MEPPSSKFIPSSQFGSVAPDGSRPVFQPGDPVWITSPATYGLGGEEVYRGMVRAVSYDQHDTNAGGALDVYDWTYWVDDQFRRGDVIGLGKGMLAPVSAIDRLAELA